MKENKIAVSKKYLIIKDKNLLIIKKDSDTSFREETNFESKEILNFFPLANNTLFYTEPDEIKKLDLENLQQQPKKIIFQDENNSLLEPTILHMEHVKHKIPGMEDSICALFQTSYNKLYFSIKKEKETKEDKNKIFLTHNCIFLKHLKNNFDFVKSLFFKVYKDERDAHYLCLFILCEQIGYFYRIALDCHKEGTEDARRKIEDFFENENENSYKVIYRLEEKCLNFFHCFKLDTEKKPIQMLIGDENLIFRLINLESFYAEEEENSHEILIKHNLDSPDYFKKPKGKPLSAFVHYEKENKLDDLQNDDLVMEFLEAENSAIDFQEENEKNNSFDLETKKFNNETKNLLDNNNMNDNSKNKVEEEEKREMLIYLNQFVLSYHNQKKMQMGGTNHALNAKLIPEEFKSCFIKLGKIFFFFKHVIYCYSIEKNSISKDYPSRDIIKDVCFAEEMEEDKKTYHKSYILNNLYLSILKFEIEENYSRIEFNEIEVIDDAVKIRNFLKENMLCEWCYKPASKRCSGCKKAYYCCLDHQSLDWERHRENCNFDEKSFTDFTIITKEMENFLCKIRFEILNFYKDRNSKSLKKGINLNFQLVENSYSLLKEKHEAVQKFTAGSLKSKLEIAYFLELNKFIFEHTSNLLLLIHGFILYNKRQEAIRVLSMIKRDMVTDVAYKNFFSIIPKLYKKILIQEGVMEDDYQQGEEKLHIYFFQKTDGVYKREIFETVLEYLTFLATLGKLYYNMGEFAVTELYCIQYVSILEEIFSNSKQHQYILTNVYFQMANLYVELDEVTKALELYRQCISRCAFGEETHNNYNIKIYSFYNSGLIYYITDQYSLAKKMLDIALETNKKKNNNIDNEISAIIYETLGEVELEYSKYGEALNYLVKALDLRKKLIGNQDKYALKRISFFINFIYDQYNYEETNLGLTSANRLLEAERNKARLSSFNQSVLLGNTNNFNNYSNTINNIQVSNNFNNPSLLMNNNSLLQKTSTLLANKTNNFEGETELHPKNNNNKHENSDDEDDNAFNYNFTNFFKTNMQNLTETYKNLSLKVKPKEIDKPESHMLNPNLPQTLREEEIEEVEKFFLFMTKLNQEEIEILNKDQIPSEVNLPINFSDAFKTKLSYSQKIQLLEMKVLKLRRNIVLKDPRGKIEVENLNFEILQRKNNSKRKMDNVLNRYANYQNLEKWVENNVNINSYSNNNNANYNFSETSKKNANSNYQEEKDFNHNTGINYDFNKNDGDFNNEKLGDEFNFNLSSREKLLFLEFKESLIGFIRNNPSLGYEMLSDEDIVTIIQNSNEDDIKYGIENPQNVLSNSQNNEYMSES